MKTNNNGTGRIKGNSLSQVTRPAVELVSATSNPMGTLFSIWHGSRHERSVSANVAQALYEGKLINEEVAGYICDCYPEHAGVNGDDVQNVIYQIAKMNLIANVPSAESVYFTFKIDNASVAFREQLVRSKFASYWTQTSRTADLTTMDVNKSQWIESDDKASSIYDNAVDTVRQAYIKLSQLGIPTEEIRLAPESRTHRVYWMISLRSLLPIITKRCDWMAQASLWSPIVADVSNILRIIDPMFEEFISQPPVTIAHNSTNQLYVAHHKYDNENEDRYYGRDPQPVDPLWLAYKGLTMPEHTDLKFYDAMKRDFINLWSDDVLDILGWNRSNPDKLGKYDRPVSKEM